MHYFEILFWNKIVHFFLQTLTKSKKAKEFDQLMLEIEALQRKILSQEEEFRLQNETLMHELGSVSVFS